MMISGVLSVSQMGPGATAYKSDCGPACTCTVLRAMKGISKTPDEFYTYIHPYDDVGTSIRHLMDFLAIFEVKSGSFLNAGIDVLRKYVDAQRLAIWLINYEPLSSAGCVQYKGTFNHWVTVVGYDDKNVYINDPYRTDGESYIPVPNGVWLVASWKTGLVTTDSYTGGATMEPNYRVVSSVGGLNVRVGPGVSYQIVSTLRTGEEVYVSSYSGDWVKIEGPRLYGYCYFPYLEPIPGAIPPTEIDIRIKALNELKNYLEKQIADLEALRGGKVVSL